jgi:LmbE family N-acetylglucosaminyl deacetylase
MNNHVLALFAHPDDETMLSGGLLALLAREGLQVHFVCATRGEGGEMGEPPVAPRHLLGEVRSQELACAVKALGGSSLSFLDYIDPLVGADEELYPFTDDIDTLVNQIQDQLTETQSQVVLTHGSNGEYGHPAHVLLHQAARQAVETSNIGVSLYTVQACFENHPKPRLANRDDQADIVIDVQPLLEAKIQAAYCHRSQHALFTRRTSESLGHPVQVADVIIPLESLHRVRLNGMSPGKDELFALIEKTGLAVH